MILIHMSHFFCLIVLRLIAKLKGFHVYKEIWSPSTRDIITAQHQPENAKDQFTVVVINDGKEVGHLRIGKSGRFSKTIPS